MSAMTYNSLFAQIQSYLNNTSVDVTNQIPNFIYQAEQRLSRESKALLLESYVVATFTPGESVVAKPATWRRTLSINYGSGAGDNIRNQLFLRSYEYCRAYWPDSTQTAPPQYYADYGYIAWIFAPTPDLAYPFEIAYLALPDPISAFNQTNFITDYCPDLFLYACLLESVPFLKNDERIATWQMYYDRGLASLNMQDDERLLDRASNRSSD